ncbi:MAG: AhpC/TSA family protein [Bacteriovorax sp.]|nr:AhpC/TSA family protein [Bacteriovorax sp.]
MKKETTQSHVDILALNRLSVFNERKEEILVSSLWKTNSVIIVFLRHFGCIACRAHVDQVWKNKMELEKSGSKIIFIGNGSPEMIKPFKEDMNVSDAPIFTNPNHEIFDACGFNRGVKYLMTPQSAMKMVKLYWEGYSQGTQQKGNGEHTQMGGILAIKPPGKVTYHYVSEYLGDFDEQTNWN